MLSVPLMLAYLGNEMFGIWTAFSGFVTFLQFTDLGLGIGLQNSLTSCSGTDDRVRPSRLISAALAAMVIAASLLLCAAIFLVPIAPLEAIVRTTTDAARAQLVPSTRMFLIGFAVVLPLGLVQYICNAYQRNYVTNGCFAATNLIAFAGLLVGIAAGLPLWWFIFVGTVAPAPSYLALGSVIARRKPWLRPGFRSFSFHDLRTVMRLGVPALGAQVGATLMAQGPTIVILSVVGAGALVPFALSQRLLSISTILLSVLMLPLWPAYGEAAARRDIPWIHSTFRRSSRLSFAIVGATAALILCFGRPLIHLWTGRSDIVPSLSLLLACGVWACLTAWINVCSMLLNGLGRMTGQAIYGTILPLISIAVCIRFGPAVGVVGIVWITILCGEACRAAFVTWEAWSLLRSLRTTNAQSLEWQAEGQL